jgi:hypothetical protein
MYVSRVVTSLSQPAAHRGSASATPGAGAFEIGTSDMERSSFIYQGPSSKQGHPVFYIIASRFNAAWFTDGTDVERHIFRVMDPVATVEPYELLLDMSWASLSGESKTLIIKKITTLYGQLSRAYRKNLKAVYIVHPSAFTRTIMLIMSTFTSRKLKRKIHNIYSWRCVRACVRACVRMRACA